MTVAACNYPQSTEKRVRRIKIFVIVRGCTMVFIFRGDRAQLLSSFSYMLFWSRKGQISKEKVSRRNPSDWLNYCIWCMIHCPVPISCDKPSQGAFTPNRLACCLEARPWCHLRKVMKVRNDLGAVDSKGGRDCLYMFFFSSLTLFFLLSSPSSCPSNMRMRSTNRTNLPEPH